VPPRRQDHWAACATRPWPADPVGLRRWCPVCPVRRDRSAWACLRARPYRLSRSYRLCRPCRAAWSHSRSLTRVVPCGHGVAARAPAVIRVPGRRRHHARGACRRLSRPAGLGPGHVPTRQARCAPARAALSRLGVPPCHSGH
jgi:hypothetical protein